MIDINIIDYLANSLEVPEASTNNCEITVFNYNNIRISNYINILEYDEDIIKILLSDKTVVISGVSMTIGYIDEKLIIINGNIANICFEGSV